jgi:aspartyl-tRNA synthetase
MVRSHSGKVPARPAGNGIKEIATGEIEVVCDEIEVLSQKTAPLPYRR